MPPQASGSGRGLPCGAPPSHVPPRRAAPAPAPASWRAAVAARRAAAARNPRARPPAPPGRSATYRRAAGAPRARRRRRCVPGCSEAEGEDEGGGKGGGKGGGEGGTWIELEWAEALAEAKTAAACKVEVEAEDRGLRAEGRGCALGRGLRPLWRASCARRSSAARCIARRFIRQPQWRAAPQCNRCALAASRWHASGSRSSRQHSKQTKGLPSGAGESSGGGGGCSSTATAVGNSRECSRRTHAALDAFAAEGQPRRQCGVRGSSSIQVCTNAWQLAKRLRHAERCKAAGVRRQSSLRWPENWIATATSTVPAGAIAGKKNLRGVETS